MARSTKQNPCPVCGDEDTSCLTKEDGITVCIKGEDYRNDPPAGLRFVKLAADNMGAIFAPIGDEQKPRTAHKPPQAAPKQYRYAKDDRPQKWTDEYRYTDSNGNFLYRVGRVALGGGKKRFDQQRFDAVSSQWIGGEQCMEGVERVPYRLNELKSSKLIFVDEGERDCHTAQSSGLETRLGAVSTCNPGGALKGWNGWGKRYLTGKTVVIFPDNDDAGFDHARRVYQDVAPHATQCVIVQLPNLPPKGDLSDFLDAGGTVEEIEHLVLAALDDPEAYGLDSLPATKQEDKKAESKGPPQEQGREFLQIAFQKLYGDCPWICADGVLYRWMGDHYKEVPMSEEHRRIAKYCNAYQVVEVKDEIERIKYPYANPFNVKKVFEWAAMSLGVNPDRINPPGLNTEDGVLTIEWNRRVPTWRIEPHDPERHLYTYPPKVRYNPDADPTQCGRLLAALDEPFRSIFLGTIAASLDLRGIRKLRDRFPRALLMKGDGRNGKDALRFAVWTLLGGTPGAISCVSLEDFRAYDSGRKFPLCPLRHSRINWPSETSDAIRIDRLQSLKTAITGDKGALTFEKKNQNAEQGEANCVFLFNINDVPNLAANLEAILSRWAIIPCTKTFKSNPDPARGELQADPRFVEDAQFVSEQVLPALLNRLLEALQNIAQRGINYTAAESALQDVRIENSHLLQFCADSGLHEDPDGQLTAGDIWERLESWYIDNGTLEVHTGTRGAKRNVWTEQVRRDDRLCTGQNQVIARFRELFPKVKQTTLRLGEKRSPRVALAGLAFQFTSSSGQDSARSARQPSDSKENCPPGCPPHERHVPAQGSNDVEMSGQSAGSERPNERPENGSTEGSAGRAGTNLTYQESQSTNGHHPQPKEEDLDNGGWY